MRIITRKRLNEFVEKHPDTKSALQHWYKQTRAGEFKSFVELWKVFAVQIRLAN